MAGSLLLINAPAGPSDAISLSGQGGVSLSAPASLPAPYGLYAGIAIFQSPTSAVPISFGGQGSATISGVVYAPGAVRPRSSGKSVETTQVAPTVLRLLGLDPSGLQAVRIEGTQVLPGIH